MLEFYAGGVDVHPTASGLSVARKKKNQNPIMRVKFLCFTLGGHAWQSFLPSSGHPSIFKSALPALSSKAPLFMRPGRTTRHLTAAWATKIVHGLLAGLVLEPFSLHYLRRGVTTLAFKQGVDLQSIKALSTWRSDALWAYLEVAHRREQAASGLKAALFA